MRIGWLAIFLVGCQPGVGPAEGVPVDPPRPTMRQWLEAGDAGREILESGESFDPGQWR